MTVRIVAAVGILCLLTLQCGAPSLPVIQILQPGPGATLVGDAAPLAQTVKVRVPLPGCGATAVPVDPGSFRALLAGTEDGRPVWEREITADFGAAVLDPRTGAYTWSGEVTLPQFGEHSLRFTVANVQGSGAATRDLRAEQSLSRFSGGDYLLSLSRLSQEPGSCLAPQIFLDLILPVIKDLVFPVYLPSGEEIVASGNAYPLTIGLGPVPAIAVELSVDEDANNVQMDGPEDYTFALAGLMPIPGLDCILTAAIEGAFDDVEPADIDGFLRWDLQVVAAPGGDCALIPAMDRCALVMGLDTDVY